MITVLGVTLTGSELLSLCSYALNVLIVPLGVHYMRLTRRVTAAEAFIAANKEVKEKTFENALNVRDHEGKIVLLDQRVWDLQQGDRRQISQYVAKELRSGTDRRKNVPDRRTHTEFWPDDTRTGPKDRRGSKGK